MNFIKKWKRINELEKELDKREKRYKEISKSLETISFSGPTRFELMMELEEHNDFIKKCRDELKQMM